MKLDRTTYEAWLLDRMEGTLSPAQLRELDDFLRANPDLATEVPDCDPPMLRAEDPGFDDKASLKRTLPPQGFPTAFTLQDFLVALGEGDLDPQQQQALAEYLDQHPEARREARLMALARVRPDHVPMPGREALKRTFPPTGAVDRHRLTDLLIAAQEGDLGPAEQQALRAYLAAHPEAERERRLVAAARVQAPAVTHPDRAGLYRGRGRVLPLFRRPALLRHAAAAALLLSLGLWALLELPNGERTTLAGRPEVPAAAQQATPMPPVTVGAATQHPAPPAHEPQARTMPRTDQAAQEVQRTAAPTTIVTARPTDMVREVTLVARLEPVRTEAPPIAVQTPVAVAAKAPAPASPTPEEFLAATTPTGPPTAPPTLGGLIAQQLRHKVLDQPHADARPLNEADAAAAVDKGLRRLGGEQAGLAVEQRDGRITRFDLRLGPGLTVSASRGR